MSRQDIMFQIGLAIGRIAQTVDEDTFQIIKKDLETIESNVLKLIAEEHEE